MIEILKLKKHHSCFDPIPLDSEHQERAMTHLCLVCPGLLAALRNSPYIDRPTPRPVAARFDADLC